MLAALFAQQPEGGGPAATLPLLLLVVMGLFWVVVVIPAGRRQKKEQQAMLAALKPGAKVQLASGIIGSVVTAKEGEDEIVIRSEDTKLRVVRSSVTQVVTTETPAAK